MDLPINRTLLTAARSAGFALGAPRVGRRLQCCYSGCRRLTAPPAQEASRLPPVALPDARGAGAAHSPRRALDDNDRCHSGGRRLRPPAQESPRLPPINDDGQSSTVAQSPVGS
ncbi:MAG: hypothetical protein IPO81_00160 [Kouleothrix sp.]|nr:hypothetical protein [Kouleothrix sp.]